MFEGTITPDRVHSLRGIAGQTTGALRASLGLVSNFADVYTYVQFAKTFVA